jgi:hypothetical protein
MTFKEWMEEQLEKIKEAKEEEMDKYISADENEKGYEALKLVVYSIIDLYNIFLAIYNRYIYIELEEQKKEVK